MFQVIDKSSLDTFTKSLRFCFDSLTYNFTYYNLCDRKKTLHRLIFDKLQESNDNHSKIQIQITLMTMFMIVKTMITRFQNGNGHISNFDV